MSTHQLPEDGFRISPPAGETSPHYAHEYDAHGHGGDFTRTPEDIKLLNGSLRHTIKACVFLGWLPAEAMQFAKKVCKMNRAYRLHLFKQIKAARATRRPANAEDIKLLNLSLRHSIEALVNLGWLPAEAMQFAKKRQKMSRAQRLFILNLIKTGLRCSPAEDPLP